MGKWINRQYYCNRQAMNTNALTTDDSSQERADFQRLTQYQSSYDLHCAIQTEKVTGFQLKGFA